MKHSIFLAFTRSVISCLVFIFLTACHLPFSPQGTDSDLEGLESGKGRVEINLSDSRSFLARDTISPPASQIDGYRISAAGGTGGPAPSLCKTGSARLDLNPGTWTITVEALSASSALISKGSTSVTVTAGTAVQALITLFPSAGTGGTGAIHLDIRWPASMTVSSGTAAYIPPGGSGATSVNLDMSQAASSRSSFDLLSCPSGSYLFTISLFAGADPAVQARIVVVQVVDGLTTSGTVEFTSLDGINPPSTGTILSLAGNGTSSFVVKGDGTLWAWGDNTDGALGNGNTSEMVWGPHQIGSDSNWSSVYSADTGSIGSPDAFAIKNDGTLWAWGNNDYCRLGLGDQLPRTSPQQVGTDSDWKIIEPASNYTLAIKTNGTLWNWGSPPYPLPDAADGSTSGIPLQLGSDTDWVDLSAGNNHALAIKADGTLWAWGDNSYGGLGIEGTASEPVPRQVGTDSDWKMVQVLSFASAAIKTDGSLWVWGQNDQGELGLGEASIGAVATPTRWGSETWKDITRNNAQFLVLKSDGSLWTWGWQDSMGRTGSIDASVLQTQPAALGTSKDWDRICAAGWYILASKTDGSLWFSGDKYNEDSQDFAFPEPSSLSNVPLQVGTDLGWKAVSAASTHSLAIDRDDKLWSWGADYDGQLGTSDEVVSHAFPVCVDPASTWKTVSSGVGFSLGIKTDGSLWAWGDNLYGQLGTGNNTDSHRPVRVGTDNDWKKISAGSYHVLALKTDGSLWTWGNGGNGRLGLGAISIKYVPTRVGTDLDWTDIAAGEAYSVGLKAASGTLWTWGYNNYGQLGMGMTTALTVPTKVGSGTFWSGISAGGSHTLATRTDGTLWAWGYNANGQLGLGTNSTVKSPTQVGTIATWMRPIAAGNSSFGFRSDGNQVSAWGANNYGQLGLGTTTPLGLTSPVDGTVSDWLDINARSLHCLGIRSDGSLWAWGYNQDGQLGQGRNPTVWKQVLLP